MGISILHSTAAKCGDHKLRIRLVHADGSTHHFTVAISAGEALQQSCLNLQQPQHSKADISNMRLNNFLICDSASLRIGKRACPMHPNRQLEVGHLYYVLPIRAFQNRMSWSYISSLAQLAATATTTSCSPSAAATQMPLCETSPSSKRGPVGRTFARRTPKYVLFYLQLLLHHRLALRGRGRRVNDMDVASVCAAGASSGLPLHIDSWIRAGGELSYKCRSRPEAASRRFNNICDDPEMNARYVEQLIDRSNSWRPPLCTIQECLAV